MIIRPFCQSARYALLGLNFRLFSKIGYYARVVPVLVPHVIMSVFFEHPILFEVNCAYNRGPLNTAYKWLYSSIYIAFGAVVAVQVFLILILSVLARHANLIQAQNRFLCDLSCK